VSETSNFDRTAFVERTRELLGESARGISGQLTPVRTRSVTLNEGFTVDYLLERMRVLWRTSEASQAIKHVEAAALEVLHGKV
jgi:hypothetical protein